MPKKLKIMSWADAVLLEAKSPIKYGKPTKRKCLCIGRNYYWKDTPTSTWDCYPDLAKYIYNCIGVNPTDTGVSCLINVYTEKDHNIGFHIDKSDDLLNDKNENIYSWSLDISDKNTDIPYTYKAIGQMVFKGPNNYKKIIVIYNGGEHIVAWNGISHKQNDIKHKARTLKPRINITVRLHNDYDRAKQVQREIAHRDIW